MARKDKPDVEGMSEAERNEWLEGKTMSQAIEASGCFPEGTIPVVAAIPKDGSFNRCSVCRTGLTAENVAGVPVMVRTTDGVGLPSVVMVCSLECARRFDA